MRAFIYIFLLTMIGCADTTHEDKSLKIEKLSEPATSVTTPGNCSAKDLLKLRNQELQFDFFRQLDSLRKVQYPGNDQDTNNSVDITPGLFRQFLTDINAETL